jgi:ABC-type phosphate transport system substrate-binding protein
MLRILFWCCAAMLSVVAPRIAHAQTSVVVVVNAANSVAKLSKEQVSHIFLKKVVTWEHGKTIVPVDQVRSSKVRELFTELVHNRKVSAVETYWQVRIFSGKDVPPVTKASDDSVLTLVRANPNAIGYVNAKTPLGADVKVVKVEGL